MIMFDPKGLSPMSDAPKAPVEPTPVLEMPWVLISYQIQQLNDNMNQRFYDERLRMDDRCAAQERHMNDRFVAQNQQINDRFAAQERRMDDRFAAVDQRLDKLEHRLEFRVSTWIAVVLAALTLIIGALLGHSTGF
jgi:tetrahydromethanopterin S-methyltransferase subunit G